MYVIHKRRFLVVGISCFLALCSMVFSLTQKPDHTAEATIGLAPKDKLSADGNRQAFLNTVMGAVDTNKLSREAMREADWKAGTEEFNRHLDVETFATRDGTPGGLLVRFSDPRAKEASRVANIYATLFVNRVKQLGKDRLVGASLNAKAHIEKKAKPPVEEGLRVPIYTAAAAGAGFLIGVMVAMLLEGRVRSWRDARDAEVTLHVPVLGSIPEYPETRKEV